MTSRFTTLTMFVLLACLTSAVSGQTRYYQAPMVQPVPMAYPQTYAAGAWNAGSPTGISASPQRLPQPYSPPGMRVPVAAGYAPTMAAQPAQNPAYYLPRGRSARCAVLLDGNQAGCWAHSTSLPRGDWLFRAQRCTFATADLRAFATADLRASLSWVGRTCFRWAASRRRKI